MFDPKEEAIKTIQEIPVPKTRKNLGWERLKPGCKLWEINLADLSDIKEAQYNISSFEGKGPIKTIHHQVIIKPGYGHQQEECSEEVLEGESGV